MGRPRFRGIFLTLMIFSGAAHALEINEIRIDQPSTDVDEYFELVGSPGESLDGLSYVVIGDGPGGSGVVEALIPLDGLSIPDDGFFLAGESSFSLNQEIPDLITPLNFENGDNVTHLLVTGFSIDVALGDDLDTSDPEDGMLDTQPWESVFDAVGLVKSPNSGNDFSYGGFLGFSDVGPAPGDFVPGHIFRASDAGSSWVIGQFNPGESEDTPGKSNTGEIIEPPIADCDFDADGDCDTMDVDSLTFVGNLVVGLTDGFDAKFDLNADDLVNGDDLSEWLSSAGEKNGFAGPLLPGDANLDGKVNATDLNVAGINWLRGAQWSGGDFNGDGLVNAGDLNILAINWLTTVPPATASPAAVPEPGGGFVILSWLLPLFFARRVWSGL